mgnify:CR=1 FL=1
MKLYSELVFNLSFLKKLFSGLLFCFLFSPAIFCMNNGFCDRRESERSCFSEKEKNYNNKRGFLVRKCRRNHIKRRYDNSYKISSSDVWLLVEMQHAAKTNNIGKIEVLMEGGGNRFINFCYNGAYLIHLAASHGHADMVLYLLKRGADPFFFSGWIWA